MANEPELQDAIIDDLKEQGYFSLKDNGAKTQIRAELARKYSVEAVWIKDVVINGYGKQGRRIEDGKIIEILGSKIENIRIAKTSEDPAEGWVFFKDPPAKLFFVSSAPIQAGIGLLKTMDAVASSDATGLVILNNGNDGPLSDDEFYRIKNLFDKAGVYSAGVYNGGITHKPGKLALTADKTAVDLKLLFPLEVNLQAVGLCFEKPILERVVASLLAKRLLIATGLAGSGKTKLSQALAEWLTPKRDGTSDCSPHVALVPVGADWTGNDNLVGYPNGLDSLSYNSKPALELILHANDHPGVPHFLILDEMNLSHVERYFADILSAMESEAAIPLHQDGQRTANGRDVPNAVVLPPNLFIIGTVNVDETTYMFSPKVLDRANVIEFRMESEEIAAFLEAPKAVKLTELNGKGASFGASFVAAAGDKSRTVPEAVKGKFKEEMLLFFKLLQAHQAEFGYRTSYEAGRFIHFYQELGGYADGDVTWFEAAMDAVIVQKLLPKLHGSRTKLEGLLWALGYACGADRGEMTAAEFLAVCQEAGSAQHESKHSPDTVQKALKGAVARYPLSFDKILRMYHKLVRDQFVTFAEA